jgi:hypothetical protein
MLCGGIVHSEALEGRLARCYSGKGRVGADIFRQTAAVLVFIVMVRTMTANQSQGVCNSTIPETFTDSERCSHFPILYCRFMPSPEDRAHSTFAVCILGPGG